MVVDRLRVAILVFGLALIFFSLVSSCAGQLPNSSPAGTGDGTYHNIKWVEINPPRDGLRCWAAQWKDDGYGGYAISYCEEGAR